MKALKFTDAELAAVRFVVAGAATADPENLELRTALAKLDGPALARRLEIVILEAGGGQALLFTGLARRWTPVHVATLRQAKWRAGKADRIVVRLDGHEVNPEDLGLNEPF